MKRKRIRNEYNPFFSIAYINRKIEELADTCNTMDFESKKMDIINKLDNLEKR